METTMLNVLDPLEFRDRYLLEKINIGKLLFCKIWGSHSHATQLPESDVDYLGVYVAHNCQILGLHKPAETLTGEKPDYQVHEVGKFCDLLLKGNPGIIEMLFTQRMMWADPRWEPLYENRKEFLTQRVVKQYLGYAQAQIKRLEAGQSVHSKGGKVGEKWAYHMFRIVLDAERIAKGEEPLVWKSGSERDTLMDIRTGRIPPLDVVRMTKAHIEDIDAMPGWKMDLPAEGDEVFLDDWLLWVRGINPHKPMV
jgi:hypothetical protein